MSAKGLYRNIINKTNVNFLREIGQLANGLKSMVNVINGSFKDFRENSIPICQFFRLPEE